MPTRKRGAWPNGYEDAAHATTAEGMRRAILAGVDTIEHGTRISEADVDLFLLRRADGPDGAFLDERKMADGNIYRAAGGGDSHEAARGAPGARRASGRRSALPPQPPEVVMRGFGGADITEQAREVVLKALDSVGDDESESAEDEQRAQLKAQDRRGVRKVRVK